MLEMPTKVGFFLYGANERNRPGEGVDSLRATLQRPHAPDRPTLPRRRLPRYRAA